MVFKVVRLVKMRLRVVARIKLPFLRPTAHSGSVCDLILSYVDRFSTQNVNSVRHVARVPNARMAATLGATVSNSASGTRVGSRSHLPVCTPPHVPYNTETLSLFRISKFRNLALFPTLMGRF